MTQSTPQRATEGGQTKRLAYTMKESADLINRCERSIWQAIQDGDLKSIRLGRSVRIRAEELDRYLRDAES